MYLQHFQLKEHPFQVTPDIHYLFLSKVHSRAMAYMEYSLRGNDGIVVITGEIGSGKTTLIKKLLSGLDDSLILAKIFHTKINEVELLQSILEELGIECKSENKIELLSALRNYLVTQFSRNKKVVLIVDEAQNLSQEVLEELRLLSGLEGAKEKLFHIILVGQPELRTILDSPQMAQFLQRVKLSFHIRALNEEESRDYIHHRVSVAGGAATLFQEDVFPMIYEYTGGTPRLINILCDLALICAFADEEPVITKLELREALEELQWKTFAHRQAMMLATPDQTGSHPGAYTQSSESFMNNQASIAQINHKIDGLTVLLSKLVTSLDTLSRSFAARLETLHQYDDDGSE